MRFQCSQRRGVHHRNVKLFVTTLTLDKLIAAAAKAGGSNQPVHGYSNPIANGMPTTL